MYNTHSIFQRLGALYCLYCLYETQPFKPPFKIYLSFGELRSLKTLVVEAKEIGIKVVSAVVRRMLEENAFLFGLVSLNDYSEKERIKELVNVQNAYIQKMHEKLLANTDIERYLFMDLGTELDLNVLEKMSSEYEGTKSLAIRDASRVADVQNIKHIAEGGTTVGGEMKKIMEEWDSQMRVFSQQTGLNQNAIVPCVERENQEQLLSLPAAEPQLGDDNDDMQHTSFLELLFGDESPQADDNFHRSSVNQRLEPEQADQEDDDSEFIRDLEDQLFDDAL